MNIEISLNIDIDEKKFNNMNKKEIMQFAKEVEFHRSTVDNMRHEVLRVLEDVDAEKGK
ncbi:hypothetical protein IEN91_04955 [Bacillus velezensis]|uniref:hypothetical protein n=1 Tax=Bacillus velezensis TaxID=492670 RepID=UPI0018C51D3D|nr:hypothetical protein [Bacillus velezensis]QPK89793.1 hypothetical protein IEN91_04955 [Bacillus velezensis]